MNSRRKDLFGYNRRPAVVALTADGRRAIVRTQTIELDPDGIALFREMFIEPLRNGLRRLLRLLKPPPSGTS
jgi:hypothetical protein